MSQTHRWVLQTNDFKQADLNAEVKSCLRSDLFRQAAKSLAIFWGLSFFSILIPALHFFLVPLFFIIGIYKASSILKYKNKIDYGSYDCPECKVQSQVTDLYFADEMRFRCKHCGVYILLREG